MEDRPGSLPVLYIFWPYLYYSFTHIQPAIPPDQSNLLGWFFPLLGGHFLTLGVAGTMPGDGWQDHAPATLRFIVERAQWISRVAIGGGMAGNGDGGTAGLVRDPPAQIGKRHRPPLFFAISRFGFAKPFLTGSEACLFRPTLLCGNVDRIHIFRLDGRRLGPVTYPENFFDRNDRGLCRIAAAGHGHYRRDDRRDGRHAQLLLRHIAGESGRRDVQKLCQYSGNSNVSIQLPQWKSFPLAWKVILELNPPPPGPRPRRNLLVRYRDAEPPDAHIEVEEVPGS